MADPLVESLMQLYYGGYSSPATENYRADPYNELGTQVATQDINARMPQTNALSGLVRALAGHVPENTEHGLSAFNMLRSGLGSAANWLEGRPEIGKDTLAPLALAGTGIKLGAPVRRVAAEWPVDAAIKVGDQTFSGQNHFHALEKARAALGRDPLDAFEVVGDGFVTNLGRYVSRVEAARLQEAKLGVRRSGPYADYLDSTEVNPRSPTKYELRQQQKTKTVAPGAIVNGLGGGQ